MIKTIKINHGTGETNSDGDKILATATVTLECGAILTGIEVIRTDRDETKVSRDSRPLFTTKEIRRDFCAKIVSAYQAA